MGKQRMGLKRESGKKRSKRKKQAEMVAESLATLLTAYLRLKYPDLCC